MSASSGRTFSQAQQLWNSSRLQKAPAVRGISVTTLAEWFCGLWLPLLLYSTPFPHGFGGGTETRDIQDTQEGCLLPIQQSTYRKGEMIAKATEERRGNP